MRVLIAILSAAVLLTSCQKELPQNAVQKGIVGKWELTTEQGGWIGTRSYPPGNGNTIEFTKDTYKWVRVIDGVSYTESGNYRVYSGTGCDNQPASMIEFTTGLKYTMSFRITGGQLVLDPSCIIADGVTSTFRRIE